jgi:hypothetical protein
MRNLQMTNTEKALAELNRRIEAGGEFPDVVGRVAAMFRIKEETLTRAYDAQFDRGIGLTDVRR